MDVRQAVQEYLDAKRPLSRATQKGYRRRLMTFVAWCEEQQLQLEQLSARHIRTYTDVMSQRKGVKGETLAPSSVGLYVRTVKTFLSWCVKEEDEDFMVAPKMVSRIQLPKADQTVIETFSPEQQDKITVRNARAHAR
jgi:site-specific recombinase XerD